MCFEGLGVGLGTDRADSEGSNHILNFELSGGAFVRVLP